MAGYDGSIRINTQISTKAAQQSLGTLAYTIKGTAKEISSLRSKMDALKGQKLPTEEYKKASSQYEKASKTFDSLIDKQAQLKSQGKDSGAAWEKLNAQIALADKELKSAYYDVQNLVKEGKDFVLGEDTAQYAAYGRQIEYEQAAMEKMKRQYQELEKLGDPYARLSQSVSDLNAKLTAIIKPMQTFKQAFSSNSVDVSGYERLSSAWGELKEKVISLLSVSKRAFSNIRENGIWAIVDMTNKMRSTLTSRLGDALEKTSEKIGEILMRPVAAAMKAGAAIKYAFGSAAEAAKEKLAGLGGLLINSLLHPFQTIKSVATSTMNGVGAVLKSALTPALEDIKARAAGVAATIINGIVHPFRAMKTVAGSAISTTSKLLSGMASAAKKVGSAVKNIVSLLKKAASSMSLFGNSTKSSNNMLQSGFKNLLKYGLGIRSMYVLINKFRTAVKEGFGNLAKYSEPVNSALSSLKSALTQLKNSLATAFAPILTAAAPALTALINLASKAATAVGMLVAALTGQKSFVKAIAVQENYASSLGKTAGAAKKAVKALAGFDKLNVLGKNDSDDSGGGGGGGAGVGDMFETVDIPSKISDLAKLIKDAWEKADFTEIGALIGTKLKNALDNIPWDKIQDTAARVGKSLATLINGFVEVEGLGYSIGNTIAQAINTGLIGLEAFAKNLHWDSVGKFIADGINGALINIDWATALSAASLLGTGLADMLNNAFTPTVFANIGYTIGMGLNTALTFANNFLTKFEWHNFGSNIGNGLGVAIETIDWELLGDSVANLLNAFFDTFGGIAEKFPWEEFGSSVGTSLSTAISNFRWSDAGGNIGKFVSGLFSTLKSFIDDTDWKELGKGITTAIASFLGNIDWKTVSGTISSFAIGILNFLTGLIKGVDWSAVPQAIIDGISDFFSGFDYAGTFGSFGELVGSAVAAGIDLLAALGDVLSNAWDGVVEYFSGYIEDSGGNIIQGLLNGIISAIAGIGNWIKKNIFDPFIKGFKSAFGIHSPSKVMAEQGDYIVSGLMEGILDKWSEFINFWIEKKNEIIEKFNDIKEKFLEKGRNIIEGIKNGIINKWSEFYSYWTDRKNAIIDKFKDIKDKFIAKGKDIVSGIKEGIKNLWAEFSSFWGEKKKSIINKFSDIKDKMFNVGKNIVNGIIEGIKSIWSTLTGWAQKIIDMFTIKVGASDGGGTNASSGAAAYSAQTAASYSSRISAFSNVAAPKIPQLASGAVIRGGNPFIAELGDQPRWQTNVETPLPTMLKAMKQAIAESGGMGGGEYTFIAQLEGKTIFEETIRQNDMYIDRTGRNRFVH